ncbi:5-(carboxyamino)imidazole ribonucleotide synthase [Chitinophagaceae bacterium IBVUCB1]|nr:5-(carboxyamino)imidazole ribonucleotide synthase [Chitinophagaceae bacterium IBVUCB1]
MFLQKKIGILGGGQLGAMLIRHAVDFGLKINILDNDKAAPCANYSSGFVLGDTLNYDDVMKFGENLDIITIEKEAVNTQALHDLQTKGVKVYPAPETVEIIQDKLTQKRFLESHNIPVVPAIAIENRLELRQYAEKLPACLKLRRDGYDGKGVMILKSADDIANAFDKPSILEDLVDIKHEISVIVTRNEEGEIKCYDPILMEFDKVKLLLDYQISPCDIGENIAQEAITIAQQIAKALQLKGILAVEMFVTKSGKVLVNELAPRPHNSGHHTIEGCNTSQYEQLLRVITGMPLGDTASTAHTIMINIIEPPAERKGSTEAALKAIAQIQGVHIHWYGKSEGRAGRKMGHINITAKSHDEAVTLANKTRNTFNSLYEKN